MCVQIQLYYLKKLIPLLLVFFGMVNNLTGQSVGIGTTTPNASAALEIASTTKGFLLPRVTTAQRDAIVSPAIGLMILNLDDKCTDVFNGSKWIKNCGLEKTGTTFTDAWIEKAPFPGPPRLGAVGLSIGNNGYVGTGNSGDNFYNDFWEYNPTTNTWTQKASLPTAAGRSNAVGFSILNKGYVGTGNNFFGSTLSDFWEYDPSTNFWVQKADLPGPRSHAVGVSTGFSGYIGTGYNGFTDRKEFWRYNINNTWTQIPDLPAQARSGAVGIGISSLVPGVNFAYVGFGNNGDVALTNGNDIWQLNPTSNTWIKYATVGDKERDAGIGFAMQNGASYFGGGEANMGINKYVDFYLSLAGGNASASELPSNTGVTFTIGNKGYLLTNDNKFYEYNPSVEVNTYQHTGTPAFTNNEQWRRDGNTLQNNNGGDVFINTQSGTTNIGKLKVDKIENEAFAAPFLINGWTSFGSPYAQPGFYKDKEGRVYLSGLMKGAGPSSTPISKAFTLPLGYRPKNGTLIFTTAGSAGQSRIDINLNGEVFVVTGTIGYISLDGISFRAD